jgi:hypothetical protein
VCCSETSVNLHRNVQRYVPESFNIHVIKFILHNYILEIALHFHIQFDINTWLQVRQHCLTLCSTICLVFPRQKHAYFINAGTGKWN